MDHSSSPGRGSRTLGYLRISIYGAGLALLWASINNIILPTRILEFVPEASKATYLGIITSAGLLVAMLVQPIAGAVSDRSAPRWGRRRPFILVGTLLAVAFLPGISFANTFLFLAVVYVALQFSANIAQAAYQAFIPDLVSRDKHGVASGVKSLVETLFAVGVVRLVASMMGQSGEGTFQELHSSMALLGGILLAGMVATLFLVREKPARPHAHPPLASALVGTFKIDPDVRRDFLWFLASRLLVLMAPKTLLTYAFFYLGDVVGASNPAEATGDILIALGISMLATVYAAAHVSDRLGRKPVLLGSGVVGIAGIGLLLLAGSYPAVLAAAALLGASSGSFLGTNWALAADLVPAGEEGRYMGLTNIATAGAGALAIPLMGPVIDFFNSRSPGQGYTAMLIACALYIAVGTVLVLRVRVKGKAPVGTNQEPGGTA